jgi:hypothetical protein
MPTPLNNPKAIAEAGERIYQEKFKAEMEPAQTGKFLAINVLKETASLGDTPEQAFEAARAADPAGVFHLVRVGYAGAFQMSYQYRHGSTDWLFG